MVNHAIIQGRLCADPDLKQTQSGTAVCSFRVAWSEKYKETETKLFLSCTAWRSTGEMVSKYFRKGQEIVVEGKLTTREWEGKDGTKRTSVEMVCDRVHFCGPKQGGGPSVDDLAKYGNVTFKEEADDGELPF